MLWETIISALLLVGALFTLLGSIGLLRLPDFLTRLHAPTKTATLGVGGMLLASMLDLALRGQPSLHQLLIVLFLFLTAPVSAQLLAAAGLRQAAVREEHTEGASRPPVSRAPPPV